MQYLRLRLCAEWAGLKLGQVRQVFLRQGSLAGLLATTLLLSSQLRLLRAFSTADSVVI